MHVSDLAICALDENSLALGTLENVKAAIDAGKRGRAPADLIALATRDPNDPGSMVRYEKTISNLKEVKARSGIVIALATEGDHEIKEAADHVIYVPPAPEELSAILEIVPLQLLAYHIAVRRGCDVDQPRNLAKSVTVE